MADQYVNKTGLQYFYNRIKTLFAAQADLTALSGRVDDIVSEGGEPNNINTISVNGATVAPDANKNVELTVPTKTSDLQNDGDGTSDFATESYVNTNGGKIDIISVNGSDQPITNKKVALVIPVNVSDLTNDENYQTAIQVQSAIDGAVASAYKYQGSVATEEDLPASGNTVGAVYDVQATGINYAWTGDEWDALGSYVDTSLLWAKNELTAITTAEIDEILNPSA